jgi:hypothetical protein
LFANARPYKAAAELQLWSMQRVKAYLSQFVFRRKVEKFGQFTLFANTYSLGRPYARARVEIRLDPHSEEWLVSDEQGTVLRRLKSRELDYALISYLQLAKRRKS